MCTNMYVDVIASHLCMYLLMFTWTRAVYRPGETGVYWYAVLSGSLEMSDVDAEDSSKTTTLCHLSQGDSFGENVIFGTCRWVW